MRDVLARLERDTAPPPISPVVELPPEPPAPSPPVGASSTPATTTPAASTPAATTPANPISGPGSGPIRTPGDQRQACRSDLRRDGRPPGRDARTGGGLDQRGSRRVQGDNLGNEACDAVRKAIEGFFAARQPDDIALLYYYGIAVKDSETGLEFITLDSEGDDPSSSIQVFELQKAMRRSKSLRQLVVLDCVFLGAYTKDLPLASAIAGASWRSSRARAGLCLRPPRPCG